MERLLLLPLLAALFSCAAEVIEPVDVADTTEVEAGQDLSFEIHCPDTMVTWPKGVCAPKVDECEAWELAVIGGGCLPIGPRGCEKTWYPDSEADCEPGEFLPCPDGYLEIGDSAGCVPRFDDCPDLEIPVMGGGCERVGPPADSLFMKEWVFSDCPPGQLATPGGGCVHLGPRVCPATWSDKSDWDCDPGETLPCPEGWDESEDQVYCTPVYGFCIEGQRPLLGGGCKRGVPSKDECPPGPYPVPPVGTAEVVYVDQLSPCQQNCGGEEAPFSSIQAAVDSVGDSGCVLVAAGEYDEGISIIKPVRVAGLCAAKVRISGVVDVVSKKSNPTSEAGVSIADCSGVELSGVGIVSPATGIAVTGATDVAITGVEITGSKMAGVVMAGISSASMKDSWIHEMAIPEDSGFDGVGIRLEAASKLHLDGTLVEMARGAGLFLKKAGTELHASNCTVKWTQPGPTGFGGSGVRVTDNAAVFLDTVVLGKNRTAGLLLSLGGHAVVSNSFIRQTFADASGGFGAGVYVESGSTLQLSLSNVEVNSGFGVQAKGKGSELFLDRAVVRGTTATEDGQMGWGIQVAAGAAGTISGCLVDKNTEVGIAAYLPGSELELTGTLVRNTAPAVDGAHGNGLRAEEGPQVSVSDCLFEGNSESTLSASGAGTNLIVHRSVVREVAAAAPPSSSGLFLDGGASAGLFDSLFDSCLVGAVEAVGSGTKLSLTKSVVRGTQPAVQGGVASGLEVNQGAEATISECLFKENVEHGIAVFEAGARADIINTVIRDTRLTAKGEVGRGLLVYDTAEVTMSNSLIERSGGIGLVVQDAGTVVSLADSAVRDTQPDSDGLHGLGIASTDGAELSLSNCIIERNVDQGVFVFGPGASFTMDGCVVRKTVPDALGQGGYGISMSSGTTASVSRSLINGNTGMGVASYDIGSALYLDSTVVKNTNLSPDGLHGRGVEIGMGSFGTISGCLIEGNAEVGVLIATENPGSLIERTVIRETRQNATSGDNLTGIGLVAQEGGDTVVSGALIELNTNAGVVAMGRGTDLGVHGVIVRHTVPGSDGSYGNGIVAQGKAKMQVSYSKFENNQTSGVTAAQTGTLIVMSNCVVTDTVPGGAYINDNQMFQVFGDGVYAGGGATLDMESSIVMNNARCGAYYFWGHGDFVHNYIAGNASFGLALEKSTLAVHYQEGPNYIFGNCLGLPPGQSVEITTAPEGLPVPPPPPIDLE